MPHTEIFSQSTITVALQIRPGVRVYFLENISVADPDHEIGRGGPGLVLLDLPSVVSSFFTQNKGVRPRATRAPPLDPPLPPLTNRELKHARF